MTYKLLAGIAILALLVPILPATGYESSTSQENIVINATSTEYREIVYSTKPMILAKIKHDNSTENKFSSLEGDIEITSPNNYEKVSGTIIISTRYTVDDSAASKYTIVLYVDGEEVDHYDVPSYLYSSSHDFQFVLGYDPANFCSERSTEKEVRAKH